MPDNARVSIANDLHDEIGAALSSISFFSEACRLQLAKGKTEETAALVEKIGSHARATAQSMNDIIWMVHPKNDETGKLIERLQTFGNEIFSTTDTIFSIHHNEELELVKLPIELRKNMFLICKEAIHNIAKYAHSKSARIDISKTKTELLVIINDDGIGFNTQTETAGNGLLSMKVRAASVHATLLINSVVNKGTCISLRFPLSP
jgi:signal transduction histidine kinase